MKCVILESPYAGDVEENIKYAREALRDSLSKGEAPIASHLLYTQEGVLDDTVPEERDWGIAAGLSWLVSCGQTVVYMDLGVSTGMLHGIEQAARNGNSIEYRYIRSKKEGSK